MTNEEFDLVHTHNPDAVRVWMDRMHDTSKGQLVSELLVHMDREFFAGVIIQINNDIAESREEESNE